MSTNLVVPTNNLVNIDSLTGLAAFKPKISNFTLIQPTSTKFGTARPGIFIDTNSSETFESMEIVVLRVTKGRLFYDPNTDFNNAEVLCKSFDNIVPAKFIERPQAAECAKCRHSRWGAKTEKNKSGRPACNETRNLLFIDRATNTPARIEFKGNAIAAVDAFTSYAMTTVNNLRKAGEDVQLYDLSFTMSAVREKAYYVPLWRNAKHLKGFDEYRAYFEELVLSKFNQQDEEEAEIVTEQATTKAIEGVVEAQFVDA